MSGPAAVIFDVDGTLYWQKGLRRRMLWDLLFGAVRSASVREDIRIIKCFREDREELGTRITSGFAAAQYRVTAEKLGIPPARVEEAVRLWIYERPLPYLRKHRVPGIDLWMRQLREAGVKLAVYSEYPAYDKLKALELEVDAVVSSVDPDVDAFKPSPKGVEVALARLGVAPERALFVGDRLDRDRPCAEAAGVEFLWVDSRAKGAVASFPPPKEKIPAFLPVAR